MFPWSCLGLWIIVADSYAEDSISHSDNMRRRLDDSSFDDLASFPLSFGLLHDELVDRRIFDTERQKVCRAS